MNWGEFGTDNGFFNIPHGIAVDANYVYITDCHNHRCQIFNKTGKFIKSFGQKGSSNEQFLFPYGIAVCKGFLYICDCANHRIQVFTTDGNFVRTFGSHGNLEGQFDRPFSVVVDRDDNILVCDQTNSRIQVFNKDIIFFKEIPLEDTLSYGISIHPNGSIFVSYYSKHKIAIFGAPELKDKFITKSLYHN